MKRRTDEKGNLLICIKVEVYDMGAIYHMANIRHYLSSCITLSKVSQFALKPGYVYLIHEVCVAEEVSKLYPLHNPISVRWGVLGGHVQGRFS
jgi:hypothetical protein